MPPKACSKTHPNEHVKDVLNPLPPGSRYGFIEIEQAPIPLTNPIPQMYRTILSATTVAVLMVLRYRLSLLAVIVGLLALEGVLRTLEPRLLGRVYSNQFTAGHPIEVFAPGIRGGPVNLAKSSGTLRMVACGDSVTFGTGVAASSAWPARLEERLTVTPASTVEVMNTAQPGIDLRQITAAFDEIWAQYDPDRVIVLLSGNMVSLGWIRRDITPEPPQNPYLDVVHHSQSPLHRVAGIRHRVAVPGALMLGVESFKFMLGIDSHAPDPTSPFGVMLAHGYQAPAMDDSMYAEAWQILEQDLSYLKVRTEAAGADLIVSYAPPRFSLTDRFRDNLKWVHKARLTEDPISLSAAICERLAIPFVDPRNELRQVLRSKSPTYVIADYTHFDRAGHEAIVSAMIPELIHSDPYAGNPAQQSSNQPQADQLCLNSRD